jgi:hypothetical protein
MEAEYEEEEEEEKKMKITFMTDNYILCIFRIYPFLIIANV